MADEFIIPEFLEGYTEENIYDTIQDILPPDIDTSQGSHVYNVTRPTAIVLAELYEMVLPQVIQLIFPKWSYGEYLDAHAETRGMSRRAATAATGEITITGDEGTAIPAGSVFSTASLSSEDPSVSYQTTEEATIPASGSVTVEIECTQTGTVGNAAANTVILLGSTISGITAVTNEAAISGGTDEEDDESLIARIVEYDQSQGDSFVGNVADYKRWALSVAGVGSATVVPANDSTGLVTIVITDSNGDPATESLCTSVYNYIMQPDDPDTRLAPVNANLSVVAPTIVHIAIVANVELIEDADIDTVKSAFLASLDTYLEEAMADREIKITRIEAILSSTDGVNDFSALQIGKMIGSPITYGSTNLTITGTEMPVVEASDLTLSVTSVDSHGESNDITVSDDGDGNVTVTGVIATSDGNGNVTIG